MDGERINGSETAVDEPRNDQRIIEPEIIYSGGDDSIPVVEPATISSDPDSNEPSRRRGRPRGSRNANSTKRKETPSDLTGLLVGLHYMGAVMFEVKELEIEEDEAKKLAASISKVSELYGGVVLPEKVVALANLAIAVGTVYGPRYVAYNQRVKAERKEGKRPITINAQPSQVM